MSVLWEVRRRLEEWEPKMHIDKEVRALITCFNNIQFSPKSDFAFIAHLPNRSSFSFLFILLRAWNLEQCGLRWPKAPQWWQTMCLGPLGFLGRDLAPWFYSFFNMEHWDLMWPITPHWWHVGTNLDPLNSLGWDLNIGLGLRAFLSTFWFLLWGGMYIDLSFKVKHTIGTQSGTTTWLQHIFSSVRFSNQTLGMHLKRFISDLRSSTSLLDKTNLASKSIFKH